MPPFFNTSNTRLDYNSECVRPGSPLSLQEARELVERYVQHYNEKRLHSAIGYVTPMDKLEGRENKIFQQRNKKLE
jgi:putative transposase